MYTIPVNEEDNIFSMKIQLLIARLEYHKEKLNWSSLPGKWFYNVLIDFKNDNKDLLEQICTDCSEEAAAICDNEVVPVSHAELRTAVIIVHVQSALLVLNTLNMEPME